MTASAVGFQIQSFRYGDAFTSGPLILRLSKTVNSLKEVVVDGFTKAEQARRLAYNIQVIETERFKNTTLDLAQVLDKVNGVKVREVGGVGSDISINVNGFTGRHIKIFIDGVPMEGMGSAFSLNNMPAGFAKRIEVYKGVIPIWLGGDALGGAINIVTDRGRKGTRGNFSYSYGSFNTHKSNAFVEHTTESGLL